MKNDNRQNTPEHDAMAEAAIAMLDTKFLKALSDPTRVQIVKKLILLGACLLYTSPSPRDKRQSRMPSSA